MNKYDFSLILPCYNEGPTFEESVGKIVKELNRTKKRWEIIFVEDKSLDETKQTLEKLLKKINGARAIFHKKNMGRGKSVMDGIQASSSPICGFMDVDCEISPSYIPLFIQEVKNGASIAVGKRFYEKGWKSISRVVTSKVYANLVKFLLNLPISDTEAGFKFFNRSRILKIISKTHDHGWFWDTEICARAYYEKIKVSEIPVLFVRRLDKKSTVNLLSDSVNYFTKIIKFRSKVSRARLN